MQSWRSALIWGIGAAVIHRLALLLWMTLVWLTFGTNMSNTAEVHRKQELTPLDSSPITQVTLGVWRRWDAIHYLSLAETGYQMHDPGPTVFGVLTPLGIALFDRLLPGPVDGGAMAFATLAFALALIFLFRVCEVYYGDTRLAKWAVVFTALHPLSYFFSAPMSEALYLAMVLAVFYAGTREHWGRAAAAGVLATLTRSQGVFLVGIMALMMLRREQTLPLKEQIRHAVRHGWMLAFVPGSLLVFLIFRQSQGFPPLEDTYARYSYVFFVNPFEGLLMNLRWIVEHPTEAVWSVDLWMLVIAITLALFQMRYPLHRQLPLLAYTWGSIFIFVTKVNWGWGTQEAFFTQSFGRYTLALFPLTVLAADGVRRLTGRKQALVITVLSSGLAFFSALHALGIGPA
jgi:hypothetical protein